MATMRVTLSIVVLATLAATAGCSSTESSQDVSRADRLLEHYVSAWERGRHGETSPQDLADDGEIMDPGQLQEKFELLAHEYPSHVPTLMATAIVAYEAGQPATAQLYLDRLLALRAAHPEAAVLRSRIAIEEGNLGFARKLLEEQIQLTPDDARLRETYASVLSLGGRYEEARVQLVYASKFGAPEWRVSYNMGLVEEALGHADKAIDLYARAIAGNPTFAAAHSRRTALEAVVAAGNLPSFESPPAGVKH